MTNKPDSDGGADFASKMAIFERQEEEFLQFICDADITCESMADTEEDSEKPLTGLQCLLALTTILDATARLRQSNTHLERRIENLENYKLLAEVSAIRLADCICVCSYQFLDSLVAVHWPRTRDNPGSILGHAKLML